MNPQERLAEIVELLEDGWFSDNPNQSEIAEQINWLIQRVKTLEKALDKIDSAKELFWTFRDSHYVEMIDNEIRKALAGDVE